METPLRLFPPLKGFFLMFDLTRYYFSKVLLSAVLTALSFSAVAAGLSDAPEPFPQSSLQSSKDISSSGHLVLFSPIREVRNEIRSEVRSEERRVGKDRK